MLNSVAKLVVPCHPTMAAQTCVASVTVGPHTELKAGRGTRADEYDIHADVGDILFTKEQLAQKTAELGRVLGKEYAGKSPLLMPILKGGFICKPNSALLSLHGLL